MAAAANGFAASLSCGMASSYSSTSRSQVRLLYGRTLQPLVSRTRHPVLTPVCQTQTANRTDHFNSSSHVSPLHLLNTSPADRYTNAKSSIAVIGVDVHTAPVELREKLSIPEEQWSEAIGELCSLNHIEEAAVLSTCNRIEIYVLALSEERGVKEVTEWMSKRSGVAVSEISKHRTLLYNKDASQHLFEVASGLHSLVLGEGQILAQVRRVVKVGGKNIGRTIRKLFEKAITAGARVRTETSISSGSVSVSSAAVELAQTKLPESSYASARVVVVGAGNMGKLVIKHLVAKGCEKIVVVNRSEEKVAAIREEFENAEIIYKPFSEMLSSAAEADVIFTATKSETPLFSKEKVQNQIGRGLFVDISVPRNVEAGVSELENAFVYNVDDLKEVVSANMEDRQRKAMEAQTIIMEDLSEFEDWKDSQQTVPTIIKYRAYVERIRKAEEEKCLSKIGDGLTEKQRAAIHSLTMSIANKFLQGPMEHLRCDGSGNRSLDEILDNMHAINRMYGLNTQT